MKQIQLSYKDKEYKLEYTRATVERMERAGFAIQNIEKGMYASTIPTLFHGAFFEHHKFIKRHEAEEIMDSVSDLSELVSKLIEMYNDTLLSVIEGNDKGKEGNAVWTASW